MRLPTMAQTPKFPSRTLFTRFQLAVGPDTAFTLTFRLSRGLAMALDLQAMIDREQVMKLGSRSSQRTQFPHLTWPPPAL